MDLTLKKIDVSKTDVKLKHEFIIDTEENFTLPDSEQVKVLCTYIKAGELPSFARAIEDGSSYFDMRAIFKKHVLEIYNLKVNGIEIKLANQFLELPSCEALDSIVYSVFKHLRAQGSLTDDEVKNSDSDISA